MLNVADSDIKFTFPLVPWLYMVLEKHSFFLVRLCLNKKLRCKVNFFCLYSLKKSFCNNSLISLSEVDFPCDEKENRLLKLHRRIFEGDFVIEFAGDGGG